MVILHPTAVVDPTAELAENVTIGPFVVIGPHVKIGAGTVIDGHSWIYERSVIGQYCRLYPGVIIGTPPQDLSYKNEPTGVVIGNNVQIHEYVTIHRACGEGNETVIGDNCLLMAYSHIGHNCQLANNIIIENNVHVGGYVEIGEYANLGSSAFIHPYCRIGRFTMISRLDGTQQDIPPFSTTDGRKESVRNLNKIGLKRQGISPETINHLKDAFRLLWFKQIPQAEAILQLVERYPDDPHIQELIGFILTSQREIRHSPKFELEEQLEEVDSI